MTNRKPIILALLLLPAISGPGAAITYSGSLSVETGGLDGVGIWVDMSLLPPDEQPNWIPATITWTVSDNPDFSWHYVYELTVYRGDVSHMIIETSLDFTFDDVLNCSEDYDVQWYTPGPSNPEMPENIYGVKFDDLTETTEIITFDSPRMPVWGNFYSRDGKAGGGQNAVWNTGFVDPEFDPETPPSDGSYRFHILAPDTVVGEEVIPEPASLALLLMGSAGSVLHARRRNR